MILVIAVCIGNIQYTAVNGTEISLPTSISYCDSSYLKGVLIRLSHGSGRFTITEYKVHIRSSTRSSNAIHLPDHHKVKVNMIELRTSRA